MRRLLLTAGLMLAFAGLATAISFDELGLRRIADPPLGLPPVSIPAENEPTAGKIALGRKLFFDRRLSRNGTMSCGMCHVPEQGFTNNEVKTPVGTEGQSIRRNAPDLYNVAYRAPLFLDGRETALETQAIAPLIDPREMANPSIGYVIAKIEALPDYAGLFEGAFGGGPNATRLGEAIASYERTLLSANSPFDRWHYGGEESAISEAAKRGFELFAGDAGCSACHLVSEDYALFTDNAFHSTGIGYEANRKRTSPDPVPVEIAPGVSVPVRRDAVESVGLPPQSDFGRLEVTENPDDLFKYKTPSLRNVVLTAPYMHNGALRTLEEVVRFYNEGGVAHDNLDPAIRPLGLDDAQVSDLVAFLRSLTGDNVADLVADARSVPVGN